MNNFERSINKWRTATNKIYFDSNEGLARATMAIDCATVSIQSDIPYVGEQVVIDSDLLKELKTADDVENIYFDEDGLSWVGDVTVTVPARVESCPPALPVEGYPVQWDDLEYVLRAVSTDGKRPVLTGICFQKGKIVATDGYRVHWKDVGQGNAMIPGALFNRIKQDFNISHGEEKSTITYDNVTVLTEHIEGSFPDFKSIIPDKTKVDFILPDDKRFKKIVGKKVLEITIGEKAHLKAHDQDNVAIEFDLPIRLDETIRFGVNPKYLFEAMTNDTQIGFNAHNSPIVVGNNAVVMPMHLS